MTVDGMWLLYMLKRIQIHSPGDKLAGDKNFLSCIFNNGAFVILQHWLFICLCICLFAVWSDKDVAERARFDHLCDGHGSLQ